MNSFDLKSLPIAMGINNRTVNDLRKANIDEQLPEGQDIIKNQIKVKINEVLLKMRFILLLDFYISFIKFCLPGSFYILLNNLGSLPQGYENKTPLVLIGICSDINVGGECPNYLFEVLLFDNQLVHPIRLLAKAD